MKLFLESFQFFGNETGKEQPYKAGRRNTLDGGEEDFSGSPRRPDSIVRIVTAVEFCSKIIPGRLHG